MPLEKKVNKLKINGPGGKFICTAHTLPYINTSHLIMPL